MIVFLYVLTHMYVALWCAQPGASLFLHCLVALVILGFIHEWRLWRGLRIHAHTCCWHRSQRRYNEETGKLEALKCVYPECGFWFPEETICDEEN